MNEQLLKEKLKKIAYALGYIALGEKAGGIVTTLMQRKGLWDAIDALTAALRAGEIADRNRARDYIGGILRKASADLNGVPIGTRMGNYEWDGGKWKEISTDDWPMRQRQRLSEQRTTMAPSSSSAGTGSSNSASHTKPSTP